MSGARPFEAHGVSANIFRGVWESIPLLFYPSTQTQLNEITQLRERERERAGSVAEELGVTFLPYCPDDDEEGCHPYFLEKRRGTVEFPLEESFLQSMGHDPMEVP